ncbi:flagellar hook-associated protein FlgK [Marinospirillum insulare]|uniref:Flagellar hook-associated protein 1 n=1 Tax=Marinospirillum insulare TaxID=217169 RepID=A0ABQ5ZZL4_9GAMM|nr:flagellar hook-associated protein FlgK [Marinospirillum insulare]GLR63320.1 flagellar hook-associated protein FlgK [Marinospirillum insulare]
MSDLLGIGLTGLRTSRNNISVTGHNISNIDTPGYSRQRAVQITNPAFGTGHGYMGTGSRTQTIERIVDQYTIHQVRVDTSRLKDHEAYLRNASELDGLLANENSALGNALNGFFEGMQSAANDPLSKPGRQLVFSQADSVSQRFKTAQSRLTDQNNNLNTQLRTYASKINELSMGIGEINKEIVVYQGARNQPPNDLFDKRDELLRELSEIVDVNVQEQDGLNINVSIGNGIPLITGENVNKLEAVPGQNDKSRYQVNMIDSRGTKMHITNEIAGGEMGGILRYRSDTLDPALNEMGRIAMVFAGEMNNQHRAGTDLNGDQGGDLFKDINTENFQLDRITGIQRTAPAGVWLDPEGLNKLPANEFHLKERSGQLEVHDSVTGRNLFGEGVSFANVAALNTDLEATYGFRLTNGTAVNPPTDMDLTTSGIPEYIQGSGLLISPTRIGASQLERSPELTDTNKIALAGISGAENNAGTAKIGYVDLDGQNLSSFGTGPANLTGAEVTYDGTDFILTDTAGTSTTGTDNGDGTYDFTIGGSDLVLSIADATQAETGDTWTLEGTAGGQNGSGLANLQQAKLIESKDDGTGGASLGETYSMLVEQVGIKTSESRTAAQVSQATLNQSVSMRESASGVNMDEEAGNLIRFQQAYMASTQVISTAQKLFDTLIASVGR